MTTTEVAKRYFEALSAHDLETANLRTRVRAVVHGSEPEQIAEGLCVVRGGFPLRAMNVYLLADRIRTPGPRTRGAWIRGLQAAV